MRADTGARIETARLASFFFNYLEMHERLTTRPVLFISWDPATDSKLSIVDYSISRCL